MRTERIVIACAALLLGIASAVSASPDHPVVGRWNVLGEAGGVVWAFQEDGALVLTGPGEIMSRGTWATASGEREFDAEIVVDVTEQVLTILGQVSPDLTEVALHVSATEPGDPTGWTPWPAESRLVGARFGMFAEPTPSPSPDPLECRRPRWIDGTIDWDRCDPEVPAGE